MPKEYTDPDDDWFGRTTYTILNNSYNNSREFIPKEQTPGDLFFDITQNGKTVKIDKVLLERNTSEEGASVTFHYKHNLYFKPGELSTVVVKYHQDLIHGGDSISNDYLWNYVIGTGSTWKGSIGEFILIKPSTWEGSIDGMKVIMQNNYVTILRAADYKPSRNLVFTLSLGGYESAIEHYYEYPDKELPELKKMWTERTKSIIQPSEAVQPFITDITASSFLPDRLSIFTNNGVITKANFSPNAAFDGYTETSWCENVEGDGIGEYIELLLTKDVWGLSINNGFTRLPVKDWLFDINQGEIPFEEYVRDDNNGIKDYFTKNNRVKKMSITDLSGNILYTIELEDQRDSQTFPGIILIPGTYKFIIEEVYHGTKWKDTCLGEIVFLDSNSNHQMPLITKDKFYMEALQGVSFR